MSNQAKVIVGTVGQGVMRSGVLLVLAVLIGAYAGKVAPSTTTPTPIPNASPVATRPNATPVAATRPAATARPTAEPTPPEPSETPQNKYPSIKPNSVKATYNKTTIEYGQLPEDFAPPIPDLETPFIGISMQKARVGSMMYVNTKPFNLIAAERVCEKAYEAGLRRRSMR